MTQPLHGLLLLSALFNSLLINTADWSLGVHGTPNTELSVRSIMAVVAHFAD